MPELFASLCLLPPAAAIAAGGFQVGAQQSSSSASSSRGAGAGVGDIKAKGQRGCDSQFLLVSETATASIGSVEYVMPYALVHGGLVDITLGKQRASDSLSSSALAASFTSGCTVDSQLVGTNLSA